MRKVIILFVIFSNLNISQGFSQIFRKKLKFSAEGQLKNTPPEKIRKASKINLLIDLDTVQLNKQRESVQERMQYMDALINGALQEERLLKGELLSIEKFLKNPKINSACKVDCFPITTEFDSYLKAIQEDNFEASNNICDDVTCLCILAKEKTNRRIEILSKLYDNFEKRKLAKELLCITSPAYLDTLFDVTGQKNDLSLKSKANVDFIPDNIDIGYNYISGSDTFALNQKRAIYKAEYSIKNKIKTDIKRVNRFNETFLAWHNKTLPILNRKDIKSILDRVIKDTSKVERLNSLLSPCLDCDKRRTDSLESLLTTLKKYDSVWCPTSSIAKWLKSWLWISQGEFRLNYLDFTSPENLTEIKAKIDSNNLVQKNLNAYIQKIDSLKKCTSCKVTSLGTITVLDTLAFLINKADSITYKIKLIGESNKALKKIIAANIENSDEFLTTTKTLHAIHLPTQNTISFQRIIYHDGANDLDVISKKFPFNINKKIILPETYSVYYGFVNANKKDTSFKIEEKKEAFNDSSKFIQELNEAFKGLAEAAAPLAGFYLPLSQLSGSFLKNVKRSEPAKADGSIESFAPSNNSDSLKKIRNLPCKDLLEKINFRLWRFDLLHTMLTDYFSLPTPGKLSSGTDTTTNLITYASKATEWEPAYTNKYTFTKDGKLLGSGRYSIGRQKMFTLGAGIFFQNKSARQQEVDTTGNTFKVRNTDSREKFVLGVKIFPFKAFEADGSLLPRFPHKRISLFGGFEITKPLQNLYVGVGYDLVPGLHFSVGRHYYRKDFYKLQNNQVVDKTSGYEKSGAYYGVTIDPVVLAGILKVFFK